MILPLCVLIASALPSGSNNSNVPSTTAASVRPQEKIAASTPAPSTFQKVVDETEDQLISELFNPNSPAQKHITPYTAMPAMPHTVKELEFASSTILFVGSPRDQLSKHGIDFSTTYTCVMMGNPVGGLHPNGFAYVDNIAMASMIDTEKLFGWHGGHFIMSAEQQDGGSGNNLSTKNVGNFFVVNGAVGGTTIKWVNLYYQQLFYHDRINLNIGRFCAMDEFDVSPILWNYIGSLQANPTNLRTTWNPNASWASRVKVAVTHDTDFRFGIFQITNPSINGLNWNFYPSDTASLFSQISWNPEFCRPGSTSIFDFGKKEIPEESSSKKSFQAPVDVSKLKRLPGHYFFGGYYNPVGTAAYNTSTSLANSYAFYLHADQVVYRPNPISDAGLLFWTEFGYTPNTENAVLTFQAKGGAIYTGLIPGRRNDFTIFGIGCGDFSSSYDSYVQSQNGGTPTYEMVSELGYRINFTRFFYIQPDIQWIVNPSGLGSIPNALILGTQIGIVF